MPRVADWSEERRAQERQKAEQRKCDAAYQRYRERQQDEADLKKLQEIYAEKFGCLPEDVVVTACERGKLVQPKIYIREEMEIEENDT